MKTLITLWLMTLVASGQALRLKWNAAGDPGVMGYVVLHGTQPWQFTDQYNAGTNLTILVTENFAAGVNYFGVEALEMANGQLVASVCTNEVAITNLPTVVVSSVIMASGTIYGWQPFQTNRIHIHAPSGQRFFKAGALTIVQTNEWMFPMPPMPEVTN